MCSRQMPRQPSRADDQQTLGVRPRQTIGGQRGGGGGPPGRELAAIHQRKPSAVCGIHQEILRRYRREAAHPIARQDRGDPDAKEPLVRPRGHQEERPVSAAVNREVVMRAGWTAAVADEGLLQLLLSGAGKEPNWRTDLDRW